MIKSFLSKLFGSSEARLNKYNEIPWSFRRKWFQIVAWSGVVVLLGALVSEIGLIYVGLLFGFALDPNIVDAVVGPVTLMLGTVLLGYLFARWTETREANERDKNKDEPID